MGDAHSPIEAAQGEMERDAAVVRSALQADIHRLAQRVEETDRRYQEARGCLEHSMFQQFLECGSLQEQQRTAKALAYIFYGSTLEQDVLRLLDRVSMMYEGVESFYRNIENTYLICQEIRGSLYGARGEPKSEPTREP